MENIETRRSRMSLLALVFLALCFSFVGPVGVPSHALAQSNTGDAEIDDCVNAMIAAHASAGAAKAAASQQAVVETGSYFRNSNLSEFLGGIGDKYCFAIFQNIYNALRSISDPWNLVVAALNALINMVINYVCSMIVSAVNNVLESICLPLPGFSLPGLNAGGSNSTYCNGVSLSNFIYFRQMPVPTNLIPQIPSSTQLFNKIPLVRDIPQQGGQIPLP